MFLSVLSKFFCGLMWFCKWSIQLSELQRVSVRTTKIFPVIEMKRKLYCSSELRNGSPKTYEEILPPFLGVARWSWMALSHKHFSSKQKHINHTKSYGCRSTQLRNFRMKTSAQWTWHFERKYVYWSPALEKIYQISSLICALRTGLWVCPSVRNFQYKIALR
jgi:hypothetical protein